MRRYMYILLTVISGLAMMMNEAAGAEARTRRFSIIVGANYGGPGRQELRYAVSDARSVLHVMNRMGGVEKGDSMILVEPSRRNFFNAVNDVNRMVSLNRSKYKRIELMFYYSGHSDEEGILLNREKIQYSEIKDAIQAIPADVHIVILDSCSSGAFTRTKGGVMRSPFLMDSSYDMKGYAYMTSSSDHESSQESDRIGGSFFTHYLVSGLRGAADMSRDGRVTLNEAYQYAYGETLTQTEKTLSGPQHPHYNIRMTGTGDVVMTDIRSSSSGMLLDAGLYGRIAIRDSGNRLVAELNKGAGRELVLGLESGTYTVINERDGILYETAVRLLPGKQGRVRTATLRSTKREHTWSRGESYGDDGYKKVFFSFQFLPDMGGRYPREENTIALHLLAGMHTRVRGLAGGTGVSIVREDLKGAQLSLIGNMTKGDVTGTQMSYIFNYTGGSMKWFQLSAVYNIALKSMTGMQSAGVFNYVDGPVKGYQASSILNYAVDMRGCQTGLVNISRNTTKGAQIGIVNTGGDFTTGSQFGLVNTAGEVTGVQIGLVNISRDLNGIPLGLVNIVRNGITDFDVTGDEMGFVKAGIKHGTEHFYVLYSGGVDYKGNNTIGLGYGVRWKMGPVFSNIDISASQIDTTEVTDDPGILHAQVRAGVGTRIFGPVKLLAGISYNYAYVPETTNVRTADFYHTIDTNERHSYWPGFFVGVQY